MDSIKENVRNIIRELPEDVILVAAVKGKKSQELVEAVNAGVSVIGENYLQEAEEHFRIIGDKVKWHFIGHLQLNKVKKAVQIFDMIETVDSFKLAKEIDKRCKEIEKIIPVLIEINSAKEPQKFGVLPEDAERLIREISFFENIKIQGLMTMGPNLSDPEKLRPYFKLTKDLFEEIRTLNLNNVEMKYLSMGMTDSYKIAIEEGANIVRIGTKIFGRRK
jgi:pyridoxal phosphate enzyme (YggS family)